MEGGGNCGTDPVEPLMNQRARKQAEIGKREGGEKRLEPVVAGGVTGKRGRPGTLRVIKN